MTSQLTDLANILIGTKDQKEMVEFLRGILTPGELEEISQRLQIVKLLKKGVAQHAIAQKLGVGVATVTRGSKELQKGRFTNV
jgi:TrpR family trp operon transcriptional repressor